MCHRLDVGARLECDVLTLSLADLLLTKVQIARLTRKDVTDIVALLLDHGMGDDETAINLSYISELLAADWGWWYTVKHNLARITETLPALGLSKCEAVEAARQVAQLDSALERAPKTLKWRVRARLGTRVRWRDEPEGRA